MKITACELNLFRTLLQECDISNLKIYKAAKNLAKSNCIEALSEQDLFDIKLALDIWGPPKFVLIDHSKESRKPRKPKPKTK